LKKFFHSLISFPFQSGVIWHMRLGRNFDFEPTMEYLRENEGEWVLFKTSYLGSGTQQACRMGLMQAAHRRGMFIRTRASRWEPDRVYVVYLRSPRCLPIAATAPVFTRSTHFGVESVDGRANRMGTASRNDNIDDGTL
jgi:hypothetical protein